MDKALKLYEKELYKIWRGRLFDPQIFTNSGEKIEVIYPGDLNDSASGPDFKNARIKIGNITYVGDVEIDKDYNDWKHHGHNIDKKYNSVILHISFINKYNQEYVYNKEGRRIPSVCIANFMDQQDVKKINEKIESAYKELSYQLRCIELNNEIDYSTKERFLAELGVKRFDKKCNRIFNRLKELKFLEEMKIKEPEIGYELTEEFNNKRFKNDEFQEPILWQQLLYEFIFEALGYSKNKNIMLKLARSVPLTFLGKLGNDDDFKYRAEAALFGIAGLLPNGGSEKTEENEYIQTLKDNWENIKKIYDGKIFDKSHWHFFRLRPGNFPTIRIAGGSRLAQNILHKDLIPRMVKKITEIRKIPVLIKSLKSMLTIRAEGYWKNHYLFDGELNGEIKFLIGYGRVDEIMVNIILPFFSVYFNIFHEYALARKVFKIYTKYTQRNENKIIREIAENIDVTNIIHRSLYVQGMIELFRSFCSKNRCIECKIGNQVFN